MPGALWPRFRSMKSFDTKEALEQHLLENRDDAHAWAVYGDLLEQEGAPAGEVMAIQRALTGDLEPRALQSMRDQLKNALFLHRDWYWGPAWEVAKHLVRADQQSSLTWAHGFVDSFEVPAPPLTGSPGVLTSTHAEVFFAAKALRFLRRLSLPDAALIPELRLEPRPVLELELRAETGWHGTERRTVAASELAQAFPLLRSLFVSGEVFEVNAVLPKLDRLVAGDGDGVRHALGAAAFVQAAREERFPALRELGFTLLDAPTLVQLSELPLAAQLVRLECPLTLEAAQTLLARRECFPALQAVRPGRSMTPGIVRERSQLQPELDAAFKKRRTRASTGAGAHPSKASKPGSGPR
jgi:hypothetical protein